MTAQLKKLLDDMASIVAQMEALTGGDEPMTDEGADELKALEEKGEALRAKIELYERASAREAELRSVIERAAPKSVVDPEPPKETRSVPTESKAEIRPLPYTSKDLTYFRSEEEAYRSGMWLRGHLFGDSEARRWCVDHGVETRAGGTPAQFGREYGTDVHSPSLGGATVNDEMARTIIRNVLDYGAFKYARTVTMQSDVVALPKFTKGIEVTAVGENVQAPEKTVEVANIKLTCGHWAAMNRIPFSLIEDSVIDFAELVVKDLTDAFGRRYEELLFKGDGTAAFHNMTGIITAIESGGHAGSVSKAAATHDTPAELDMADFTSAMAKLPAWALRNAAWYVSPAVFGLSMVPIGMAAGGNTRDDVAAGPNRARFLGYPVRMVHSMYSSPAAGTDKVMALFGDLSLAAAFGIRRGVQIKKSEDRYIEYDQLAIVGFSRAGVAALDLGTATEAGGVVAVTGGAAS